jgi:hypothetical protein
MRLSSIDVLVAWDGSFYPWPRKKVKQKAFKVLCVTKDLMFERANEKTYAFSCQSWP